MSNNNSDIPCSICYQWNSQRKKFLCNPDKCAKLSEWLMDHASLGKVEEENFRIIVPEAMEYVV